MMCLLCREESSNGALAVGKKREEGTIEKKSLLI